MSPFTIAPPGASGKEAWRILFEGYRRFYRMPDDPVVFETVWAWIQDPAHPTECLLAHDASGHATGLAHFRDLPRPPSGSNAGFLDDLFVAEHARGPGAAEALGNAVAGNGRTRRRACLRRFPPANTHSPRA